jgi:hypothetical protein
VSYQFPPSCPLLVLSLRRPLVVSAHRLVFASPLVAPPSHHPLTPLLSHCLISPAGCCVASRHTALSSSSHSAALIVLRQLVLHRLLSRCPLVVLPSRPLLVLSLCRPLVVSSHQLVVALPLVAPPSCRLLTPPLSCCLVPAGCCIASHCAALSSCRPLVLFSSSHCATLLVSHLTDWLLHCL